MNTTRLLVRSLFLILLTTLLMLGCPRHRPLRIIYNQSSYGSEANYSELEDSIFFGGFSQIADDFVLSSGQNIITSVRWWGVYRDNIPAADDFTVYIYEISGGEPNTHPWYEFTSNDATRTDSGHSILWGVNVLTVYEYNLEIDDCPLDPETTYLISIVNDTGRWAWMINGALDQGNDFGYARDEEWGDWSANALDSAFVLWSDR